VQEAILAEELERGLHPFVGWDLSVELDKAHACMNRTTSDRATETERLFSKSCRFSASWSTWACCPSRKFPNS
jgi:hypothetical protein